jgi:hypothetical protein
LKKRIYNPRSAAPVDVLRLADILPEVASLMQLDQTVARLAVTALWPEVMQRLNLAHLHSQATRLTRQGTQTLLWVRVPSAPGAALLGLQLPQVRAELNKYTPQTGVSIDAIRLRVG